MPEINGITEVILQFGSLGIFAVVLLIFSKYLFNYFIRMFNEEREKTQQLNQEYKEKLTTMTEDQMAIIQENTKIIKQFSEMIQRHYDLVEREDRKNNKRL